MRYNLVLKENGDCVCGFEQDEILDPVEFGAKENLSINSLVVLQIPIRLYDKLNKMEKTKACDLNKMLQNKGFYPY